MKPTTFPALALCAVLTAPLAAQAQVQGSLCRGTFSAGGGLVASSQGQSLDSTFGEAVAGAPTPNGSQPGILASGRLETECFEGYVVAVDTPPAPGLSTLRLEPARPNPFNPRTEFAFVLPSEGPVQLELFDATGRRVETLLDRNLPAGRHQLTWDGGSRPSGVYYLRLSSDRTHRVRSIVLVK